MAETEKKFAQAPGSCGLDKQFNRGWHVQVKLVDETDADWRFVRGITTTGPNIEATTVDSTDINSDGWAQEEKASRSLTLQVDGTYPTVGEKAILEPGVAVLKFTGEEIDRDGKVDVRIWRSDSDEGWEMTATNAFSSPAGAPNELRTYSASLKSSCAPRRIHSIEVGKELEASVPVTNEELRATLKPAQDESESSESTEESGA